jgi:hypothetical protein
MNHYNILHIHFEKTEQNDRSRCVRSFYHLPAKGADNLCPCKLLVLLAGLVAYGAGSLACGLAGCLALAAAALLDCIL